MNYTKKRRINSKTIDNNDNENDFKKKKNKNSHSQ